MRKKQCFMYTKLSLVQRHALDMEADRLVCFIIASIRCCDVRRVRRHLHVSALRWRGKVCLRMSLCFQFIARRFTAVCQQMIDKLIHVTLLCYTYLNRGQRTEVTSRIRSRLTRRSPARPYELDVKCSRIASLWIDRRSSLLKSLANCSSPSSILVAMNCSRTRLRFLMNI